VTPARFSAITECYAALRIAVLGDFCLDRYLEIDPARQETSIETGLPVHNVMNVRAQPGGAGTILNNLVALGIREVYPVGFAGFDGEGYELLRALKTMPRVHTSHFLQTAQRHTFTYCKPLVVASQQPPVELNRLDRKNWTPTPAALQGLLVERLRDIARFVDAVIVLDQVDLPETGVVTTRLLKTISELVREDPDLLFLADSRRGLHGFPPVIFKMNAAELRALTGETAGRGLENTQELALALTERNGRSVFVTLAGEGMVGTTARGEVQHVPALPLRGPIDVVGAGDAVSANLTAALAAGAGLKETLELANAAASVVVHKLGTTGTANIAEIAPLLLDRNYGS
jgi:rfaE bifunctional protein kinase chain/domain